jgi:hypothetical protein
MAGDPVSADSTVTGTLPLVVVETAVSAVAMRSKLDRGTGVSGLLGKGGGGALLVAVVAAFAPACGDFRCSSRRVQIFCTTGGDTADTIAVFLPLLLGLDMEVAAAAAEDIVEDAAAAAAFCKLVCGEGGASCCCNFCTASLSACN